MPSHHPISRRTCLRSLGVAIALPLLETMAQAGTPGGAAGAVRSPVRLAFFNHPLGVLADAFWPKDPKAFGATGALSPVLEPLRSVVDDCLLIDGIDNPHNNDTKASTHLVETAAWLTCASPQGGGTVNVGISADQVAAQRLGAFTVLPSLELSPQASIMSGTGEGGYALAYYQTISYRSATQPLPAESDPRAVFNRLFSSRRSVPSRRGGPKVDAGAFAGGGGTADGPSLDQSMLDLVMKDMGGLRQRVSGADLRTLDQYYDGVRDLEKRVAAIERQQQEAAKAAGGKNAKKVGKYSAPIDVRIDHVDTVKWSEHLRVLADLMILAFQTDLTRVVTMPFSHPGGISYPELGFTDNHHDLTHDAPKDPIKREKLIKLERLMIEQFTYIVKRMKSLDDGAGSLLDNSIMLWGSGMGDGSRHNNDRYPTILAGRGGGTIRPGRYLKANGVQGDLLMAMLARAGVTMEKPLGSGTKLLPDLA